MLSKIYLHNSSSDVSIEINSIVAGSIKYDKAISTSEELQFGGCIASQFQIEIYETLSEEYDELTYMQVDDSGEEHVIFDGIISNINTDNKVTSTIIAYDRLFASVNVAEWYEELFSTTDEILLSEMLNSLLTYLKYRFENVELTNDFSVKKTVLTNSLDSTSVIKWICELQGGFGYFNGNVFSVGYLSTSNPVTLNVLGGFKKDKVLTKPIDKVQIRNEEQDIGGIYGEGTNALIIQGNPLLFGKGAEELSTIAQNLYNTVKDIIYVPYEAQLPVGNASLDMFTQYTITSSNDNCLSYVLSTSLTGSQLCNQVIKAEGVERRAEAVKDVNKELYVLDYKTTRIKKDVDGFSLQIEQAKKDADTALKTVTTMSATVEGLSTEVKETRETLQSQGQQLSQNSTKIEQTSTYIDQSVVKNNEVIAKINASTEGVKIKAKNIALEGLVTANEKFKVLEDGSMEAVNGKFSGEITTEGLASVDKNPGVIFGSGYKYTYNYTNGQWSGEHSVRTGTISVLLKAGYLSLNELINFSGDGFSYEDTPVLNFNTDGIYSPDMNTERLKAQLSVSTTDLYARGARIGKPGITSTGPVLVQGDNLRVIKTLPGTTANIECDGAITAEEGVNVPLLADNTGDTKMPTPIAGTVDIGSTDKGITDVLTSYKSFIGSIHTKTAWNSIISARHRNGHSDGSYHGMYLRSLMNRDNADLIWNNQRTGTWENERTILDSRNYPTQIPAATQSAVGLMSAADKKKLDGIATGANKITVDGAMSSSSTNPVQNKVVKGQLPTSNQNATNGYIRFPSAKIQIAWIKKTVNTNINHAWGSIFETAVAYVIGNWAAAFSSVPVVSYNAYCNGDPADIGVNSYAAPTTTAAGSVYLNRATGDATSKSYTITAIAVGTYA